MSRSSAVQVTELLPEPDLRAAPSSQRVEGSWIWWIGGLLCASLHAVLVWLVVTRHFDHLFNDARHRLGPGTDFAAYYDAGTAWLTGKSVFGSGVAFGYRYHPFLAMTLGAALARLPFQFAYAVWIGLFEVLLLADVLVFRRLMTSTRRFLALAGLLFAFSPYYLELYMGNASFIAASILLLAWFSDRAGMRTLFVLLFAVSVLVKPIGLVLVPLLVMRRRSTDAAAILGIVAILAVPYFVYHPHDWRALIDVNIRGRTPGWLVHAGNQGLHGFFGTLFTRLSGIPTWKLSSYEQLPPLFRFLLTALPVILAAVTLRASWLTRSRPEVGIFLWSSVYLLGFHDVWEHSYSMLVLGLGMLWTTDFVPRRLLVVCSIGLALPTAFAFYDLRLPPGPYDPEHGWGTAVSLIHHATKPAWLLALYVACVWRAEGSRWRATAA